MLLVFISARTMYISLLSPSIVGWCQTFTQGRVKNGFQLFSLIFECYYSGALLLYCMYDDTAVSTSFNPARY